MDEGPLAAASIEQITQDLFNDWSERRKTEAAEDAETRKQRMICRYIA
jgi:hypothetical protein